MFCEESCGRTLCLVMKINYGRIITKGNKQFTQMEHKYQKTLTDYIKPCLK
jgi:hypothetical protein